MLFSSLTFFLVFLPVVFLLCRVLPLKGQNALLLVASLLFYAWGEPVYIFLMLLSITANFLGGLALAKAGANSRAAKGVLFAVVAVNLALLGYFKYYGFAAEMLQSVFAQDILPARSIVLPIGISFYTFQAMSYIIDLYRGRIEVQRSWFKLALYISFFPQLIAGPIVQYGTVEKQLSQRSASFADTAYGTKRFLYGLAKKVVLANAFAMKADEIFGLAAADISTPLAWLGAAYYAFQIYYDFSGYSDMAIGLGRMFGFHFPENFNYPYISASITEFWRRWHISLSTWFREYLYIPLGGNRKGSARTYINLMIVFLATGIWHGASMQFVAWGVFYGALLIVERLFLGRLLEKLPAFLGRVYAMVAVLVGWVIFRAPGLRAGGSIIKAMFIPTAGNAAYPVLRYIDARMVILLVVAVLLCGVLVRLVPRFKAALYSADATGAVQSAGLLLLGFYSLVLLISDTYNPFIYFRF